MHTGKLVAGVIGRKKFIYDVWGDTVNTASRLEAAGEPGRINISEATYKLICSRFSCEYRGEIPVKGKGALPMYFVGEPL
jgi:class 3 adenylate cyclase